LDSHDDCPDRGRKSCPVVSGRRRATGPEPPNGNLDCALTGCRALVADDQASVLMLVSRILKGMGLEVVTVDDGDKAVEVFSRSPLEVDICVLDVGMPGPSGFEVCRNMRQARPDVPVIFLTGYEGRDLESQIARLWPASLLRKPCDATAIRAAVGKALCPDACGVA